MLKITDKFGTQKYQYGWELHETYTGEDKDGNPKDMVKVTYYPSLRLVLSAIADKVQGDATTLDELKKLQKEYLSAVGILAERIRKLVEKKGE